MGRDHQTIARQWALLKAIPAAPRRSATSELHRHLLDLGYVVDIRTVQRDLQWLSSDFQLTSEAEGKTLYWQWMPGADGLEIPGMSRATALVFELTRQYLQPLLPPAVLKLMAPYFARADQVLEDSAISDWRSRVMHVERGPRLTLPDVDPAVRDVVCQALLDRERFEADYTPRYERRSRMYEVHPLGLVEREGVLYLVCTLWEFEDIRQLALHRMTNAKPTHRPARESPDFDLQRYVRDDAGFGYPHSDTTIRLQALFDEGAAVHLTERKLSADQKLSKTRDGRWRLRATVADTAELRWWLLGFGDGVEVEKPASLRREFREMIGNLAEMYRS